MTRDEFKAYRESLNLTQAEIAPLLGVSPDTVKSWEREKNPTNIPATVALRITDNLNVALVPGAADNLRGYRVFILPYRPRGAWIFLGAVKDWFDGFKGWPQGIGESPTTFHWTSKKYGFLIIVTGAEFVHAGKRYNDPNVNETVLEDQ